MKKKNYDKWIMVTGASTGIGRFTSEYLADIGFSVYACARKDKDLAALGKINHITPLRLDITKEEEIAAAVEVIEKTGTGLYALVNNAGITKGGPLAVLPDGILESLFDTNFFGMHRVIKAFFPMINKSHGRIVIIGSVMGFIGYPFAGPYCASKHAIEGYADCLRRELFFTKIKVSLIQPGYVKSDLWEKSTKEFALTSEQVRGSLWKPYKDVSIHFFKKFLNDAKHHGIDPGKVAGVVYKALTDRFPRSRYLVTEFNIKYRFFQILLDFEFDLYFKYLYWICRKKIGPTDGK